MSPIPLKPGSQEPGRFFMVTTSDGTTYYLTVKHSDTVSITCDRRGWENKPAKIVANKSVVPVSGAICTGKAMYIAVRLTEGRIRQNIGLAYNKVYKTKRVVGICCLPKEVLSPAVLKQSA